MTLSIIILNHNTRDLLRQTLNSIPAHDDWEIIVVDNGSTDGSTDMIKRDYPKVGLIESSRNIGFAAGNNLGLRVAQGKYLQLLNSDTEIVGDALEQLIAYLDTHPGVGMITPKVVLPDGAVDLACHRGLPTPWNAFTYFSRLESVFPESKFFAGYHQTYQNFDEVHPIEATAATAAIVRRAAIDQIGELDERFFLYGEDLDWCKRLSDAGWQIIYFPQALVRHYKSQSGKRHQDTLARKQATAHFYDTMKQFYEKHYTKKYPGWLRRLVYLGIDLKKKISR